MTVHQLLRAAVLISIVGIAGSAMAAGFKIVVHPANNTASLTKAELSAYLLKRKLTWPDGTPVVPVDQREKSPVREAILRDVFARSASAIKSYWHQQIFSGRAVPPVEKASDQEVIAFVQTSPGAIGYVSESANTGNLNVIAVR